MELNEVIEHFYKKNIKLSEEEQKNIIFEVIDNLDSGHIKIASQNANGTWVINEYAKQAILLYFQFLSSKLNTINELQWFDKVPLKCLSTSQEFRVAPGAIIRHGVYIGDNAVIMSQSFLNIGANIGARVMIDSLVTIGSCAQIGNNTHVGSNTCIGGVLEPINAMPIIIENNCFIGANCSITEGIIIKEDSVIASGVHLTKSTKIINTMDNNKIISGYIPAGSVVIPGSYQISEGININAAIIKKTITKETREKLSINEILRNTL